MVRLAPSGATVVDEVPVGRLASDGKGLLPLGGAALKDRRRVTFNGSAVATLVIDRQGRLVAPPFGFRHFGFHDHGVTARVRLPGRDYLLRRGPIEAASALSSGHRSAPEVSPNLWWPDDRAWFVATEIDYMWTYVGGPQEVIDAVLADPRLEALPARLDHSPFYDGDTLNAAR